MCRTYKLYDPTQELFLRDESLGALSSPHAEDFGIAESCTVYTVLVSLYRWLCF